MTRALDDRRLRIALLAAAALAAVLAVIALVARGGAEPPVDKAVRLVPPNALVYLHLSTDRDRDAVGKALALARRFPGWPGLRDDVLARVGTDAGPGGQRALDEFLGDEAALALLNFNGQRADPLILVRVTDRDRARSYLERRAGAAIGLTRYRGTAIRNYRTTQAAFAGDFLAMGSFQAVRAAIDLAAGRGRSLADDPGYRSAASNLPDARVADAYASATGVRRLLAPAPGLLGALGSLLDRPGLRGTSMAIIPEDKGARLQVRSSLAKGTARPAAFAPSLLDSVPADAAIVFETTRVDRLAARLVGFQAARGRQAAGTPAALSAAFVRLKADLRRRTGVNLDTQIAPLLRGEAVVAVARAFPAPVLTVVARARDEQATRGALARIQAPIARILVRRGARSGQVPAFRSVRVGKVEAFQLDLQAGFSLVYAVTDHKAILSTSVQGVRAALSGGSRIDDQNAFKAALPDRPEKVTSLVFLDFSQLLRLAQQVGLADVPGFARAQDDLGKLDSLGIASSTQGDTANVELVLRIP